MKRGRPGFSILEVLVAFVIMALVFAVLLPGQGDMLARAQRSNNQLLAADILGSLTALEHVSDISPIEAKLDLPPGWQVVKTTHPDTFHAVAGTTVTLVVYGPYRRLLAKRKLWKPSS